MATKSYTDELAAWVKKRDATRPRQDKNVVAFLAIKEDVRSAIEAGYSKLTIWEHLHEVGKIPYLYETFLKHIRRHLKDRPVVKEVKIEVKPAALNNVQTNVQTEKPVAQAGFVFNPVPNKQELL